MIDVLIKGKSFYFARDYDLTLNFQRNHLSSKEYSLEKYDNLLNFLIILEKK
jgi:hypothetical protein